MGQADRHSRRTPNQNQDQFHTPDKPASSLSTTKLKRAPARLGSLVDTPATTPALAPSTASSTARSSRKSSGLSVQGQTTLTQIDFVKRSQNQESDDYDDDDREFGYIDEAERNTARNARDVIEIEDNEDEDETLDVDDDTDTPPTTTWTSKRALSARLKNVSAKSKKNSNENDRISKKGRRKSSHKKDKGPQKDDKTLTQMNYVRRIVLDPEEDEDGELKLEYAFITPKKKNFERQPIQKREADDVQQGQSYSSAPLSQHKKRKLSPSSNSQGSDQTENKENLKASRSPATPRKIMKVEIPSSQSPESPGVAFITSSQFRHNTRSPQMRGFRISNQHNAKGKSPDLEGLDATHTAYIHPDVELGRSQLEPMPPSPSQAQRKPTEPCPPKMAHIERQAVTSKTETSSPQHRLTSTHRTVIYETDADTDYSDFEDDLPNSPSSPHVGPSNVNWQAHITDAPGIPNIESQELPPPPPPEHEVDPGALPPDSTLLSDASILYQRIHAATQFPLDPVPMINTQKMAELFPDDSNGLHSLTAPSQPSTPTKPPSVPIQTESQTLDESQDQFKSQGAGELQTEVIPESSPVAQDESSTRFDPAMRAVVVQVESSQPIDQIQRRRMEGNDDVRRGMLSRSQILSSSVMESVPIPAFWMSSQDSVGEYVLPET